MNKLSQQEINEKLKSISEWKYENNSIHKEFKTQDFVNAIGFIVKIGIFAEKMDHHPDINLYGYNKVAVTLSTHSAGGVTNNDFSLAKQIEGIRI